MRSLLMPLTRDQLFALCRAHGVRAPRSLRKAEIVGRLASAELTPEEVVGDLTSDSLRRARRALGLGPRTRRTTILAALPPSDAPPNLRDLVETAVRDLRAQWWPLGKAREFVRNLELRGTDEWKAYCQGMLGDKPKKPREVPSSPHVVYEGQGWKGYRDWLGLGPLRALRADPYWPFHQGREFVHGLDLRSNKEWRAYCKGDLRDTKGTRPDYIPASPESCYPEWVSWGDWLGTGRMYRIYARPFEEAREFARSLNLDSGADWRAWCRGERPDLPPRPRDIPTNPQRKYKPEWKGYGDWLGTRRVATKVRTTVSFLEAQRMARERGFKDQRDWKHWWHWRRPKGVPGSPDSAFPDEWEGWHAFLGTTPPGPWLEFREARDLARSLDLGGYHAWIAWRKEAPDPLGLPSNPQKVYADQWVSWGDWLGTGTVATALFQPMKWSEARALVRELHLRNQVEFKDWASGGRPDLAPRPPDLPTNPWRSYAKLWKGWGDFLGTGNLSPRARAAKFWVFQRARTYVRKLRLNNEAEWRDWLRGRRPDLKPRPPQVPTMPSKVYRDSGWKGFGDWLGSGYVHHSKRAYLSFEEAWEFAKALGLRSKTEWEAWCQGKLPGKPPRPIFVHTNPRVRYRDQWPGWKAWLGNAEADRPQRS